MYPGTQTDFALIVNGGEALLSATSAYTVYPEWDPDFSIGSYRGNEFNLKGFIFDFHYITDSEAEPVDFSECDTDCLGCRSDGSCISTCAYNTFGAECTNCHPNCYQGCMEEGTETCLEEYYCHPSCKTCEGPGEEECLNCFCGAHRSNANTDWSTCECNAGTTGASCELLCVQGCESCDGNDSDDCLMCSEGYWWDEGTCRPC